MVEEDIFEKTINQDEDTFNSSLYREKLIKTFKVFDEFCVSHKLNYSVASGTMLGAVRHRGIIPWDDDIDVIMPRPDYNRFIELTMNGMVKGYNVISSYNCKAYYLFWAKVVDQNTTIIETEHHKDCPIGVFIDVFPLDGVSQNLKEFNKQQKQFYRHLNIARILSLKGGHGLRGKLKFLIYRCIYNMNQEFLKADAVAQKIDFNSGRDVIVFGGAYGNREILDRSIFSQYQYIPFEDIKCRCILKTEYYLTRFYGDYMLLPPKEKQRSHHYHYFVDLNHGLEGRISNNKK